MHVAVAVDRSSAQIAEPIELTLTVTAPGHVTVSLPKHPESLGEFAVVSVTDVLDSPKEDQRVWTRTFRLESYAAGRQTIPPMQLSFVDARARHSQTAAIQSPPVVVVIESAVGFFASPRRFGDVEEVVPLRWGWVEWTLLTAAAALIKFARFEPTLALARRAVRQARQLVRQTAATPAAARRATRPAEEAVA